MVENLGIDGLFSIKGKTALVTGGSSGLGLMMAKGLLRNGAGVVITSRSQQKLDKARRELDSHGEIFSYAADVTDAANRKNLLNSVSNTLGSLTVVINNAGSNWGAPLKDYPDDSFEKVISTNLNAVFSLMRDAVPLLERSGDESDPARIINIGSMMTIFGAGHASVYAASKGGVVQYSKSCAIAWAPHNIQVNSILPGYITTNMTDGFKKNFPKDAELVTARIPAGRWGVPDDLAGTAIFLASSASDFVTGTFIPVDGGYSIR